MQIELDRDTFEVCMQLVYNRWTVEYDLLKQVREEKNDGSKDWQAFHDLRLKNHTHSVAIWRKHVDAMVKVAKGLSESHDDRGLDTSKSGVETSVRSKD